MPRTRLTIARHADALRSIGLDSIDAFRTFAGGTFIKNHLGLRDVIRIDLPDGPSLFLKRNLVPIRKHRWKGLLRYGRWTSSAELEWDNLEKLNRIGIATCAPVAVGAIFGAGGEQFSFILTEAAPGTPIDEVLVTLSDGKRRRAIIDLVASTIAKLHAQPLGLPTIFGRHLFLNGDAVTLIDVDRLPRPILVGRRRARDLAQLHLSIPQTIATRAERLRFVRTYSRAKRVDRKLLRHIESMVTYLSRRKPNLLATYEGRPHEH